MHRLINSRVAGHSIMGRILNTCLSTNRTYQVGLAKRYVTRNCLMRPMRISMPVYPRTKHSNLSADYTELMDQDDLISVLPANTFDNLTETVQQVALNEESQTA